jgi:ubiquinone/menaquinone biosynthesis C-methylase UbiE
MKLQEFPTTVELYDLGEVDSPWSGILSPRYHDDLVQNHIHRQFLEDASVYVEKHQNFDYWIHLLRNARRFIPFQTENQLKIMDIGSGSGNTIFRLMELFPKAQILAPDLSLPLLRYLKDEYELKYKHHSCYVLQQNAEEMIVAPESIDLVVGGAILHHLFSPERAISQCYEVLKPGGVALFFEPFAAGNQIIAMVLNHLIDINAGGLREKGGRLPSMITSRFLRFIRTKLPLSRTSNQRIAPEICEFFRALCHDLEVRKGVDKSAPVFKELDDNWLFTRGYLERVTQSLGFRKPIIYPLNRIERLFSAQIDSYLRIGLGKSLASLPEWAIDYIKRADSFFSQDVLYEMIIEGGIVLQKRQPLVHLFNLFPVRV